MSKNRTRGKRTIELVITGQGLYYALTGIWPILHMGSFIWVTGPKTDLWLVRMVGLLAFATGICLLHGRASQKYPSLLRIVAVANALAFAAIDIIYSLAGVISPVYLADAVLQLLLIPVYFIFWSRLTENDVGRMA
jgi:hypothetical protein